MIRIACASDDGKHFARGHFGSARYFIIYEMNEMTGELNLFARIENIPFEEKRDGDPAKANHVSSILQRYDVQVIIGRAIGPNLVHMRLKYLPIVSRIDTLQDALKRIHPDEVLREIQKPIGEARSVLYLQAEDA